MLTVLAAAADGAVAAGSDRLDVVAVAAVEAAATALRATPGQLPELARAGVVDAGGLGLVVVLDALAAVAAGRAPARRPRRRRRRPGRRPRTAARSAAEPDYEVMYLLDGSDDGGPPRCARRSTGSATRWPSSATEPAAPGLERPRALHRHRRRAGGGIAAGRPHGVRVEPLAEPDAFAARPRGARGGRAGRRSPSWPARPARTWWCAMPAAGRAGDRRRRDSAGPRWPAPARGTSCCWAATRRSHRSRSGRAAGARRAGQEVVVVPTASVVQGLAALAVHDPGRHAADDVVAMAEAAAGTRSGALQVAEARRSRGPGPCATR